MHVFFAVLVAAANRMYKDYGGVFRAWLTFVPIILIVEPKDMQVVLGSSKQTEKNFLYSLMHNFIGEGLITNSGKYLSLKIFV